jgi:hypothetical protein
MYFESDSLLQLCKQIYDVFNNEGYICVVGKIREQEGSKQLIGFIPSETNEYIILDKKSANTSAYTPNGFSEFLLKVILRNYPDFCGEIYKCYLDDISSKYSENDLFYCILLNRKKVELQMLDTIPSYLADIYYSQNEIQKKAGLSFNQYYRGQLANWPIVPSLYRYKEWVENESILNTRIVSDRPSDFSDCRTHFERLVRLKHYNQPSRLLDITSNPLIALYFACEYAEEHKNGFGSVHCCFSKKEKQKYALLSDSIDVLTALTQSVFRCKRPRYDKDPCDYFLNNKFSNKCPTVDCQYAEEIAHQFEKETGAKFEDINLGKLDNCIVVHPPMNNHRIIQQQGLFIMCGRNVVNPYQAPSVLKSFFINNGKRKIYLIHPSDEKKLMGELSTLGIDKYYIYGDLDKEILVEKERVLEGRCQKR